MTEPKELTGKIYDIQGFSVQDGPGIRTTVFLKGCPLRCLWCHSPESQRFDTELCRMDSKCISVEDCGACIKACPAHAISVGDALPTNSAKHLICVDYSACIGCGSCAHACIPEALYFCGKDYTVEEVFRRVDQDRSFYEGTGGGVTLSGGEPLSQPEFAVAFLKRCHETGLHTALDTTGYVDSKWIEAVLPHTDIFLFDIKCMDSALHKQLTGVPNELILSNARLIAKLGGKMQVRMPIIPGCNDAESLIESAGEFLVTLGEAVQSVQLLPYHKLGQVKYDRIRRAYPLPDTEPPSDEFMTHCKQIMESLGLTAFIH